MNAGLKLGYTLTPDRSLARLNIDRRKHGTGSAKPFSNALKGERRAVGAKKASMFIAYSTVDDEDHIINEVGIMRDLERRKTGGVKSASTCYENFKGFVQVSNMCRSREDRVENNVRPKQT
jgi:hypothetical protein